MILEQGLLPPATVSQLTELTHLDLSLLYLESVPDLSKLTKLTFLNLAGNYLPGLPPYLGNLLNLKRYEGPDIFCF